MGIIIREWRCGDCGSTFESSEKPEDVACPQCTAEEPERVFLTAPAIRSKETTFKDATVKQLAADYGLSNVSNKDGAPVKRAPAGPDAPQFAPSGVPVMQVLNSIPANARDGFSALRGQFRSPNVGLANAKFPFENRQKLIEGGK